MKVGLFGFFVVRVGQLSKVVRSFLDCEGATFCSHTERAEPAKFLQRVLACSKSRMTTGGVLTRAGRGGVTMNAWTHTPAHVHGIFRMRVTVRMRLTVFLVLLPRLALPTVFFQLLPTLHTFSIRSSKRIVFSRSSSKHCRSKKIMCCGTDGNDNEGSHNNRDIL